MSANAPGRGDFVWMDFSPHAGHEQGGRRPALVVSASAFNAKLGLAFVCPITSQVKGRGFEVVLPDGLPVKGAVLVEHMRSVDWTQRIVGGIGAAPVEVLDEVSAKLDLVLS